MFRKFYIAFTVAVVTATSAEACRRCQSDAGVILDLPSCGFWQDKGQGDTATCEANRRAAEADSFNLCGAASRQRNVFIGGRNNDLLRIGKKGDSNWKNAFFVRIQDGKNYSCGGDVQSGDTFTAVMRGRHRDVLDIFRYKGADSYIRITDRIHDGRGQRYVAGANYIARVYGNHGDIVKLYGFQSNGNIVQKARLIADGRGHGLTRLSETDVGITYGRNKDIRVRFCFDGTRWKTGYIGIGHPFKPNCDTPLNW
ncbi:hypothetical protein EDD52_1672 [Primorskyibacter sedentarius]|uniref:Uncharacterized protein n=1 Tax=Primorskyibacter sedentarius TaxID=745311 RepID=A0A4R3IHC8_9RHOB|nr:hypothetical protein [Primorskyibacter sedentarius]TCS46623.1 hypothetical protein EDD52_1672 [Primorskyibacter sedentarius]